MAIYSGSSSCSQIGTSSLKYSNDFEMWSTFFALGAVNKHRRIWYLNWGIMFWHDFGEIEIDFRCLNRCEEWLIRYGYRCQCKYYNSVHFAWKLLQNSLKYPNYCFQNAKWSFWMSLSLWFDMEFNLCSFVT